MLLIFSIIGSDPLTITYFSRWEKEVYGAFPCDVIGSFPSEIEMIAWEEE